MSLARLLTRERELLNEIDLLNTLQKDLFNELAHRQQGLIDLTVVSHLRIQIKTVDDQLARYMKTLDEVRQQIANVRVEIVKAQQAKETLEKLKAKEEAKWQLAQIARETRERDDVYIARAHRLQETNHV